MNTIIEGLSGKKTFIVGFAFLAYALGGFLSSSIPQEEAVRLILEGLAVISARAAIAKV